MKLSYRLLIIAMSALLTISLNAQRYTYPDHINRSGLNLKEQSESAVRMTFSVDEFQLTDLKVRKENFKKIAMEGQFLPNNEGAPDLPSFGKYIAVPQGAGVEVNIVNMRTEMIPDVNISPSPRIPKVTEQGPLEYNKDQKIYSTDALYPSSPVKISEQTKIRGVDAVMLGISPFQYNPVTRELYVIRDIEVEINFTGGNDVFGEERLRSRWFDPILKDAFANYASLPEINYQNTGNSRDEGAEYLIISPDVPEFLAWADSLSLFRNRQGISTMVVSTTEVGGNSVNAIETYIDNAYNTWDIPPVAVLILADYGTGSTQIMSPMWEGYCVSDHIYADVTGNDMEDIILARITAQDNTDLTSMIGKMLSHERTPPTDPGFYDNPITALGWQTERWFQICSETVGGYFKNVQGKNPVRINEIYGGNPSVDPWSTATNTYTIMNVFGPNGLGYIPSSPSALGGWSGGNASMINNAINDGAFVLMHRDHGYEQGWGEPSYSSNSLNGLTNDEYVYVFSINCLTGKYNMAGECFTEKFHRMEHGALGLIAASEVSYSFVNDTYVWGMMDHLWQDFLPDFFTTPDHRGLLPAFGNAAAKYFLEQSQWPYNQNSKAVTYNLFHHHGDAFLTLYSEMPSDLAVIHDNVLLGGLDYFTVTADTGAFIALSVDGDIIGTADATGMPVNVPIEPQVPGDTVDIVITKTNFLRYEAEIEVIPPTIPYVVYESSDINDSQGNNDGIMDYAESILLSITVENIGTVDANNVSVKLRSDDMYVTISDSTEDYGNIAALSTATVTDAFAFDVGMLPDMHPVVFELICSDGNATWTSNFSIIGHAPVLVMSEYSISDSEGNGNGRLDPGETADIALTVSNEGSSEAYNVSGLLSSDDEFISFNSNNPVYGNLVGGSSVVQNFNVTADPSTPGGYEAQFNFEATADHDIIIEDSFNLIIGQFAALILDLDPYNHSGPAIQQAFEDTELIAHYSTVIPEDLGIYKSVFTCLGIIFTGHVLTDNEAAIFQEYLENGGKMYLEGRRTWYEDPWTSLHSMFNISTIEDTWFEYDTIRGMAGTFASGMIFDVEGSSPYNDYYMEPEGTAFTLLESPLPGYGCAVAYDAGDYKTVGAAFEFSSLMDGQIPSTKERLLIEILDFFGDIVTNTREMDIKEQLNLNVYPNPFRDQTSILFSLDHSERVTISVYNINGQRISNLCDKEFTEGVHEIQWNGTDQNQQQLPAGIYFIKMQADGAVATSKIAIVN